MPARVCVLESDSARVLEVLVSIFESTNILILDEAFPCIILELLIIFCYSELQCSCVGTTAQHCGNPMMQ